MADFRRLTLNIVAVQATIDQRHYAALYLGDDDHGNNVFRMYLNGKAVSSVVWDRKLLQFRGIRYTLYARNQNFGENFVFPNEVQKKLFRKLTKGSLFRMVKISRRKAIRPKSGPKPTSSPNWGAKESKR